MLRHTAILLALSSMLFSACFNARKSAKSGDSKAQLRSKIVEFAKSHVGDKYLYAGKTPETGFDCSGFTSYVLGKYNIKTSAMSSAVAKEGKKIPLDSVLPGDLIIFGEGTRIQHVAMVVKRSKEGIICVHSTTSRGVIVENVSASTYWKPLILFARDVISG